MAAIPIYGNKPLKIEADDLEPWYVVLRCRAYQVRSNDDPMFTMTYSTQINSNVKFDN